MKKQDLRKVEERQEMARVIGEISRNAVEIATYNEREKLSQLSLEKFQAEEQYGKDSEEVKAIGEQIQAVQKALDSDYGIGSPKGMAIQAVTSALQALVQDDEKGALVALASPYLNREIYKLTEGDSATDKAVNLMAHALLSAVEFQVTGKDPLTGAVSGVTGEATAAFLTKVLYDKPPSELTANEKENISSLSQIAGGLAGALTAQANNSQAQHGGILLSGVSGAETAKRAVENNLFNMVFNPQHTNWFDIQTKTESDMLIKQADDRVRAKLREDYPISHKVLDGVVEITTAAGYTIYVAREVVVATAPMLLTGGTASALNPSLWNGLLKFAYTHPKLTETMISGTVGTLYDVKDGKFSWEKTGENYLLGGLNAGRSLPQQLAINTSYVLIDTMTDPEKMRNDTLNTLIRTSISTLTSWKVGNSLEKTDMDIIFKQILSESLSQEVDNYIIDRAKE